MTLTLTGAAPRGAVPSDDPATPALVLSLPIVRQRYADLAAALPEVTLYYAVKANPHPAVLSALRQAGAAFDVASPAEVTACLTAGATPSQLLGSNPVQARQAVAAEYADGVRTFVVDSLAEARKVADEAPGSLLLARLATSCEGSDWPLSGKFGAAADDVVTILDRAVGWGLRPAGVAFHVGSQQRQPERWCDPIATSATIFERLESLGRRPWLLDIGGGFPAEHRDPCPPVSVYGRVIESALTRAFGPCRPIVVAEPGRSLAGDAGVLEAAVIGVSERGGRRWVYLDAGVYNGLAETVGEAIRYRITTSRDGAPVRPAVLAGPTCDSTDVMCRSVPLPVSLAEGNLVRFHAAGVYTTAYATGFNGFAPLPTRVQDGP